MATNLDIWTGFCQRYEIAATSVPLFEHGADLAVATRTVGRRSPRPVLTRSSGMENLLVRETERLEEDWGRGPDGQLDGLIYMMHAATELHPVTPLYVGKAEKYGRGDGNFSANLAKLCTDKSKFARWGDGYAYHIGDLSACVLQGHDPLKRTLKYDAWAQALFQGPPFDKPVLQRPVQFWAMAWSPAEIGIWPEFRPTRLAFLEYLLIGVAGDIFPQTLLNREGFGRRGTPPVTPPLPREAAQEDAL